MNDFKLDKHSKISTGFKIPEGYFETLSESLSPYLLDEKPKTLSLWARNKQWIYGAAAVLVLSISLPIMHTIKPTSKEVENNEIENYLTYHSTLTEDDLVDLLNEEDIAKIKLNTSIDINDSDVLLNEEIEIPD
ncbi:hypothetical protein OX284_004330 [Flavobacterium sp. SUN046]|uniref:hypothetical protein n=1 Tax=Flavobacterium sp. SUN046 TaxID=3002440 RepID=UPI002DBAF83A|nr:hypothetical protein [Flavobacterium sp. SUN046]MEC4048646.1 hypothetical protein [Flavobacterium sp. SUN046]